MAVDSAGVIELAWIDKSALLCSHSYDQGWTFSAPVKLSLTQSAGDPDITVDSLQNVYAVWTEGDERTQTSSVFFTASSNEGSSFLPATEVSARRAGESVANPRIEAASPSDINILWIAHVEAMPDSFVYIHSGDGGASFGDPFTKTANGTPQLALDTSGGANLVWQGSNRDGKSVVRFARYVAGTSSLSAIIASSVATAAYPQLETDSMGGVGVALIASPNPQNRASLILLHSDDKGATFSDIESIAGGSDGPPQLATDGMGTSYIAWSRRLNNGNDDILFSRHSVFSSTNSNPVAELGNGTTATVTQHGPATRSAATTPVSGARKKEDTTSANNGSDVSANSATPIQTAASAASVSVAKSGIIYVDCNIYSCSPDIGVGINAAIAALPPNGGDIWIPPGKYNISSTVLVDKPGVDVYCAGGPFGYTNAGPPPAPTVLLNWTGKAVPVIHWATANGLGNQVVYGGGLHGCFLGGNSVSTAGLLIDSIRNAIFENLTFINFNGPALRMGVIAAAGDSRDTQYNTFRNIECKQADGSGIADQADCLQLTGDSGADSSENVFENLRLFTKDGNGITDSNGDNNVFVHVAIQRGESGTGKGIYLTGKTSVNTAAREESFYGVDAGTGGLTQDGTANGNVVYDYSTCNGAPSILILSGELTQTVSSCTGTGSNTISANQLISTGTNIVVNGKMLSAPPVGGMLAVSGSSFAPNSPVVCTDGNDVLTTAGCSTSPNMGVLSGGSCRTAAHAFASCTSMITLSRSEPDTNYAVSCMGVGPSGWPYVMGVVSKGTHSVMVQIGNGSGPAALASSFNEIDCTLTR